MKKFAWILALALPLGFTSCDSTDDQDKTLSLDRTTLTLDYNTNATLTANIEGCLWDTDDTYVATVRNGVVTANHVGQTTITASKDGQTATCRITVVPVNNFVATFPLLTWGSTYAQVKDNFSSSTFIFNGDVSSEADNMMMFGTNTSTGYPWYIYLFNQGGQSGLTASSVTFDNAIDSFDSLNEFALQYYIRQGTDDDAVIYYNAENKADATLRVVLQPVNDYSDAQLVWYPVQSVKAEVDYKAMDTQMAEAAAKIAKK